MYLECIKKFNLEQFFLILKLTLQLLQLNKNFQFSQYYSKFQKMNIA